MRSHEVLRRVIEEVGTNEGPIDSAEAKEIRVQWRRLQGRGEAFVHACEKGHFDPHR